ncbi:acetyl-CoA hydrolase/transferase C-terminal domain-containing protein [Pseudonocardia oroxyli]|uniref:Acetyl-CoA hydrolase/transferase C-terminal domain-containing protein n=1 Tax=Pseudonocardia oroxyli TaxID=366584 RepID=A0A1G7VMV5_PSEOR|nr:acetyl-CoA hydrolase/transferase C-terminal domain-containing protein [Pseudonocardia oroxyli]SDG61135.1 Acetyl-CoA hydrolase/transferase C-terminal domain-containing protein [Pseudonocardia oroxyli]
MVSLDAVVRPGSRVLLGDGCGAPSSLYGPLSEVADGVRLVLGWLPGRTDGLDLGAFADVRVLGGGPGLRRPIEAGLAHVVPCRLSAVPSILASTLRPDLVIAQLVRGPDGLHLGAESSYVRGVIDAGVPVAAVLSSAAPLAEAGPPIPPEQVTIVGETDEPPAVIPNATPTAADETIARHIAALVPEGARVQVGPGRLAQAMVGALEVPVHVDSGLLPEPVVDLDEKGLLRSASAAYLCGTERLYDWARGRRVLHPIEHTHDLGRLSTGTPLIALNAALEIDLDGQVNVEGIGEVAAGMIGGHPDFAAAAARGRGVSVIALPSTVKGEPTLVERLSRPVTTASHDVEVVVTERGVADLRGLDRRERRHALAALWS